MKKRLYFVVPDVPHASRVVDDLVSIGVDKRHIHSTARKDVRIGSLPPSTRRQHRDTLHKTARWIWRGDLVIFFTALIALVLTLLNGYSTWSIVFLILIVVTFVGGAIRTRIPNVSLQEFEGAIEHGEIVLMVDVLGDRVKEVEDAIHKRHPEATFGGSSWTVDALGL